MPKATLLYPVSCKVGGKTFRKNQGQEVDIPLAVYLSTRENFSVDMDGLTAKEIQDHMFSREKSAQKPHDPQVLMNQIKIAAVALDPEDKSNLTKENRFDSRALSRVLGYTVTSDERDEALGYDNQSDDPKGARLRLSRRPVRKEVPFQDPQSDAKGVTI